MVAADMKLLMVTN
nr:hypothetical protein [Tanacetum cinerariifolium]